MLVDRSPRCRSWGSSCVNVAFLSLEPSRPCCSAFVPSSFSTPAPPRLLLASWAPAWSPLVLVPRCLPVRALAPAPASGWARPAAARTNNCTSKTGWFLMGFSVTVPTEIQMGLWTLSQKRSQMLRQSVWQVNSVVSAALCSGILLALHQELQVPVCPCRPPRPCSVGLHGEPTENSSSRNI